MFNIRIGIFAFLVYSISINFVYGQNNSAIDSLEKKLKALTGADRISVLNMLCNEYRNFDREKAISYLSEATTLAEKSNNATELSISYNYWGLINANKSNYENALSYYFKSLQIKKQLREFEGIGKVNCNIGNIYAEQGDYIRCLDYYIRAYKIFDSLGNEKFAASISINIGTVYCTLKNYDEALQNFEKAYDALKDNEDQHAATIALGNIGAIYLTIGDYDKALETFNKFLQINIENKYQRGIGLSYERIASVYEKQEKFNEAIDYISKALEIYNSIDAKYDIATSMSVLALLYSHKGEYASALEYVHKSLNIGEELNSLVLKSSAYKGLSAIHFKKGNFKDAYDYHLLHVTFKDSIFNEENSQQLAELQTKYDSEKKEKEIKLLTKEKEVQTLALNKNRILVYSFSTGFGLILILVLVVFNGYRNKQKANNLLEVQNREIVNQKNIIEEKNKDITGSINYARLIQEAILPSEDNVLKQFLPDSFIFFKPRDIVSGDFYWMSPHLTTPEGGGTRLPMEGVEGGSLLFASVDCTGHGVPGAFMSIIGNNLLNQSVNEQNLRQPAKILDFLNDGVNKTLHQTNGENAVRDGMDIAICRLQKERDESFSLQYAGANNPLWVIRNNSNEIIEIKADKQAIGAFGGVQNPYTNHEIKLTKEDSIYIFSDGFADQFGGPKGKKFKYAKLKELLLANAEKPMVEQKKILEDVFEKWKGELEQVDDVCVIGVRF